MIKNRIDQYPKIIDALCEIKDIPKDKLFKLLKDKECKYIFFLLLKKYRCENLLKINEDFPINMKRSIIYNLKKAEESFLVNKDFRDMYFEVVDIINRSII